MFSLIVLSARSSHSFVVNEMRRSPMVERSSTLGMGIGCDTFAIDSAAVPTDT